MRVSEVNPIGFEKRESKEGGKEYKEQGAYAIVALSDKFRGFEFDLGKCIRYIIYCEYHRRNVKQYIFGHHGLQ